VIDKETKVAIHLHAQRSVFGQRFGLDPFFTILRPNFHFSVEESSLSALLHFKNQTEAAAFFALLQQQSISLPGRELCGAGLDRLANMQN